MERWLRPIVESAMPERWQEIVGTWNDDPSRRAEHQHREALVDDG
jgi:hypothetical protein